MRRQCEMISFSEREIHPFGTSPRIDGVDMHKNTIVSNRLEMKFGIKNARYHP